MAKKKGVLLMAEGYAHKQRLSERPTATDVTEKQAKAARHFSGRRGKGKREGGREAAASRINQH